MKVDEKNKQITLDYGKVVNIKDEIPQGFIRMPLMKSDKNYTFFIHKETRQIIAVKSENCKVIRS